MASIRCMVLPSSLALLLMVLCGCASDREMQIPPNASPVSSGNDKVTYTAPADGTVWVYDVGSDRIVYSGALAINQSIAVDPHADQITIDGRVVNDKGLHANQYKIYFLASANAPAQ